MSDLMIDDDVQLDPEQARARLLALRANHTRGLQHDSEDDGSVGDVIDAARQAAERDTAQRMSARAAEELEAIDAALEAIDAGTYGTCRRCGGEIPAARLDARPVALECVRCAR